MIRSLLALIAIASAAVIVPAAAEDAAPPAGRYQLTPGGGSSFVRLDTRTGAVSHCRQADGTWRCEPIADAGLADKLSALSDKVDRLSADVDRLSLRVDGLAAAAEPAPPEVADTGGEPAAVSPAKPKGVARTAVHRLLEMIRTLKHGDADTS